MGTWSAAIFGNDTSCDTKDEFFERFNAGEEPEDIKNDMLPAEEDEDRYDVLFSLAHCLWEVGELKDDLLNEVSEAIQSGKDLEVARELGADDKFLKKRIDNLNKFLDKISVPKKKPKKRVAPPVPVESKYKNGAVMVFKYEDGMWGALIAINGHFFDKETIYKYIQTTVKTMDKPTIDDVRRSYIIDANFHNRERNSFPLRNPMFYYAFDNCIAQYLTTRETKKFEVYNDSFFEIIGYLSDWGDCSGGTHKAFDYSVKTAEEFKTYAAWILTNSYNKGIFAHTDMTVDEIDKEFIERLSQ